MSAAFALHGGCGTIDPASFPQERRIACAHALRRIATAAWAALERGASALDVVEDAVASLEDCELFNAGHGAVLNRDGEAELDAAIMDGRTRAAGAVAAARTTRNPVRVARALLERGEFVLLAGRGADRYAESEGQRPVGPDYFVTEVRREQLERARRGGRVSLDHDEDYESIARKSGTVGAVARDREGHVAAATSTGGMTNKLPGRVGDTPLIGAGTFADDTSCAVSATGHGEYFIRAVLAHDVHARMAYGGATLAAAADAALEKVGRMGGDGGLIGVGRDGLPVLPFDTPGMYRAYVDGAGAIRVGIYRELE